MYAVNVQPHCNKIQSPQTPVLNPRKMFEHLIDPDYAIPADMDAMEVVAAQMKTTDWLGNLAAHDEALPGSPQAHDLARNAFSSLTNPDAPNDVKITHVMALRAPPAVRHLVSMLSAYDWNFVEQAAELRGFVVAKLLEETKDNNGRIRLRALELIGKITEVAAFTERSEVVHKTENSSEIEERIRARLAAMLPPVQEVQDVEVKDIAIVARPVKAPL
jgi:hypothetical protein